MTIADYTFVCNLNTITAMDPALAPKNPRPKPHECLIWVKAANGQTYKANVNGTLATVQTPVAPVVSDGGTTTENRISSEDIVALAGALGGAGVNITQQGSVLWLQAITPSRWR